MKLIMTTLLSMIFSINVLACVNVNQLQFCEGQLIINKSGLKGQITELLTRDRAYVIYPSFEIEVEVYLNTLGVLKGSSNGFAVNEEIMTKHGEHGSISGVYPNGNLAIQTNDFWQLEVFNSSDLARTEGCTGDGFCAGDKIKNKFGRAGYIVAYFPGQLKVLVDYPTQDRLHIWQTKDLQK